MTKFNVILKYALPPALLLFISINLSSCVHQSTQATPPDTTPLDTTFMHNFTKVQVDDPGTGGFSDASLIWIADSFYVYRYNKWHTDPQPPQYREDYTDGSSEFSISGKISPTNEIDGSCGYYRRSFGRNHFGMVYENVITEKGIKYKSIPLTLRGSDSLVFSLNGLALKSHLLYLNYHDSNAISGYRSNHTINEIVWDTIPPPSVTITFYK